MKKYCLVLNKNYLPIGIISAKQAFKSAYTENVEVVANYPNAKYTSPSGDWDIPCIVKTKRYVKLPFTKSTLSKQNIFKRDGYKCVYCGSDDKTKLTIDHVLPKSRGGKNRWDNLVTSCYACNNAKDNRTPEEMGWDRPSGNMFQPHYLLLFGSYVPRIPDSWKDFLFLK